MLCEFSAWESKSLMKQVKDHSTYQAVASNTSGSTPKELFDDLVEELDKQVHLWYISSISLWIFPWATAAAFILHTIH